MDLIILMHTNLNSRDTSQALLDPTAGATECIDFMSTAYGLLVEEMNKQVHIQYLYCNAAGSTNT